MADNRKRSPWFEHDVKPARDGVYEILLAGDKKAADVGERRFEKGKWLYVNSCAGSSFGAWRGDRWRGLASDPSAKGS